MGMPSEEELKEALAEAARMREHGEDPHHIAKALLNLNYRVEHLEQVLEAADRYLRLGQGVNEHTRLLRAVEATKAAIERTGAIEHDGLGLGG